MNTPSSRWKNNLILFLSLTTIAGAGLTVHQYRRVAELERSGHLTVVNARPAQAASKAYLDVKSPAATQEAPDTDTVADAADEATDAQPFANNARRNGAARMAARMAELMKDPAFAEAWNLQQRARLDNRYAALFNKLNLPPEKLTALQDLLVEKNNAWRDVMESAREQGLDFRNNRDDLRKMVQSLQSEVDGNIKAAIGDQAYASYQQYDATQSQRNIVNQVNQRLSYAGSSLSSTQSDQLVNIISGNGGTLTQQTIDLARGMLTADQVSALEQVYAEQSASALVREKMGGNRNGGRGGNRR